MPFKIGVFGSAVAESELTINKAKRLGKILGEKKINIITGACLGIPNEVAQEAHKYGSSIYGYSPVLDIDDQKEFTPNIDFSIYKKINYVPKKFTFSDNSEVCKKYRNVISTANCDAGIIIAGRWGAFNEFTNLYDMGKVIGVLTGTGGAADEIKRLSKKISKPSKAKMFFSNSPRKLVKMIIEELELKSNN